MGTVDDYPAKLLPAGVDGRVETGVVQFGDDWPGVFLRGDTAANYKFHLDEILRIAGERGDAMMSRVIVAGLSELLGASNVGNRSAEVNQRPVPDE